MADLDSREKDDLHDLTGISPEEVAQMEERATSQHYQSEQQHYDHEFNNIAEHYNEKFTPQHREALTPEQLRRGESKPGGAPGPVSQGTNNAAGAQQPGRRSKKLDMALNGVGGAIGQKTDNFIQKHRKLLLGVGVGSIGVAGVVGLFLFFIGLLALPNYAENIAARNFAKVTRAAQKSMAHVVREKQIISSLSDADYARAKAKYDPDGTKKSFFTRANEWRFNNTLQRLNAQNLFQSHTEKTPGGRDRLVAVTYSTDGGKTQHTVRIAEPGWFDRTFHPIRTLQARLDVQREISYALSQALKTDSLKVPGVARGPIFYKYMRENLGIGLKGLVASRYLGKDTREARIAVQQDSFSAINDDTPSTYGNADVREGADEAQDDLKQSVQDPDKVGETVDNPGQVPQEVEDKINNRLDPAKLSVWQAAGTGAVKATNFLYDVGMPICLVNDGSAIRPKDVDKKSKQAMRTTGMVMSAADQQIDGTTASGEASGAMNWKLGDTNQSNAMRRANGEQVDTLANTVSTQASPFGGFREVSLFNVLLDGASTSVADSLNKYSNEVCPVVTSLWFGVGIGVVNVVATGVLSFFSGGGAAAGQIAATQAAKQLVVQGLKHTAKFMIEKVTTKQGLKSLGKVTYKEVQFWGAVELATFISKGLVAAHATTGNGLAVGTDFANQADNGANLLGNDMIRVNFGARPLTDAEAVESMAEDDKLLYEMNSQKGVFERYFAFDNSNSMVTRVGMSLNTSLHTNMTGTMLTKVGSIFNPLTALPKLFGSMNQKVAYAANGNVASQNYGIVQFGWTKAELELIDKTPSYSSPSENEYQFGQRGDKDKIREEYGPCIDETGGKIIGEKWVDRNNETGDVAVDNGKCSPKNMGPNNPTYGDGVFRLRLIRFYDSSLSLGEGIDNPAPSRSAQSSDTTSGTGTIPSGTAQELAQKIVDEAKKEDGNIRFQLPVQLTYMEHVAKTGKGEKCGAPAVDPKILGVILAASQKYKIVIGVLVDGHRCNDGFHPKGMAIDINGVNPLNDWNGGTKNHITWSAGELEWLRPFYEDMGNLLKQASGGGEMGQIGCAPNLTKVAGIDYITDSCDHLHVAVGKK